jgi:hypothetical protein
MQLAPARSEQARLSPSASAGWYSVLDVPIMVASDVPEALERVDETYRAFRFKSTAPVVQLQLMRSAGDAGFLVTDGASVRSWSVYEDALLDLLDRMVHAILEHLLAQGKLVFHAGALEYCGGALILAGRSGQGKTTLTLGLLRRGLRLLSDELAVVDRATLDILPYRRSVHVRPGTPELIPELRFLYDRPRHARGGGSEWAVAPQDLERALPGCLGQPVPLRHVLLLEGAPRSVDTPEIRSIPAAVAALELLRGAWGASVDFEAALAQTGQLLGEARCARLRSSALEPTLDRILSWLEAHDG